MYAYKNRFNITVAGLSEILIIKQISKNILLAHTSHALIVNYNE